MAPGAPMAKVGTLPWEGAGLAWCGAWWGGHVPQLRAPWGGQVPWVLPLRENPPAGLRHRAAARGCGTGQGHAAAHGDAQPTAAAGRGQRWVRARGAGPRGLEVLMLLVKMDSPGSSAYRRLPLGRPEGQLGSAGAAGKVLGQQALPAPPPTRGQGPPSPPAAEGQGQSGVRGAPAAPNLGGGALRVPGSWCWDRDLHRSGGAGGAREERAARREPREGAGMPLLRGDTGGGGASGPPCTVLDAPEMLHGAGGTPAGSSAGGQRQQRGSPGLCAHREDGPEVVEQLDVLGDAGAGPADHVVLAARGRRGGEEPGHQDLGAGAQRVPALWGAPAGQRLPASSPRANPAAWAGVLWPRAGHCPPLPAPTTQTPRPTSGSGHSTRTGPAWPSPAAGGCQPSPGCRWPARRCCGPASLRSLAQGHAAPVALRIRRELSRPLPAAGRAGQSSAGQRATAHARGAAAGWARVAPGRASCPTGRGCTPCTLPTNPLAPEEKTQRERTCLLPRREAPARAELRGEPGWAARGGQRGTKGQGLPCTGGRDRGTAQGVAGRAPLPAGGRGRAAGPVPRHRGPT